jgi:two-component system chemotaxis response regulator CheB
VAIRVLLVDDSPFVRRVLRSALSRFGDIEVVGEAGDGASAQGLAEVLRPDVITMDILMPIMGGMEAVETITRRCRVPIVLVADVHGDRGAVALEAIARGAMELFPKPVNGFDEESAQALVRLLRIAVRSHLPPSPTTERTPTVRVPCLTPPALPTSLEAPECVGIVASTGGPRTLRAILARLPPSARCPVLVVQHTVAGFTRRLADWLAISCTLPVSLASDGRRLQAGEIVVAPDDAHLEVAPGGIQRVRVGPHVDGHRPSGTVLLRSLARTFGAKAIGVLLSGMGTDGAEGARALEAAGGLIVVEDPTSAVVAGIPGAVIAATRAPVVVSAVALPSTISRLLARGER